MHQPSVHGVGAADSVCYASYTLVGDGLSGSVHGPVGPSLPSLLGREVSAAVVVPDPEHEDYAVMITSNASSTQPCLLSVAVNSAQAQLIRPRWEREASSEADKNTRRMLPGIVPDTVTVTASAPLPANRTQGTNINAVYFSTSSNSGVHPSAKFTGLAGSCWVTVGMRGENYPAGSR